MSKGFGTKALKELNCSKSNKGKGVKMKIFEVPATRLIEEVAIDLGKKFKMEKPAFTEFVKTGSHRERAPQKENWYYVRAASILYRLAREGNLGVGSLRTYYGGRKNRGVKPHKFRKASGKIIRSALQQLEAAGLAKKGEKGRVITGTGRAYLDRKAKELKASIQEEKRKAKPQKPPKEKQAEKPREESLEKPAGKKEEKKGEALGQKKPREQETGSVKERKGGKGKPPKGQKNVEKGEKTPEENKKEEKKGG